MRRLGQLVPLVAAGVLMSGNSALAAPKSPLKAQPTYRPALQLTQAPALFAGSAQSEVQLDTQSEAQSEAQSNISTVSGALADGIYFFGAAPQRDQLGVEYMVLEVSNDQVVGAFYLPLSNFDCFNGEARSESLALNITDSYDQTTHPYSMAMETVPTSVAGTGAGSLRPAGFYTLGQPSEMEHELLSTCQAHYADSI